ncbi:sugar transferase [Halobacillus sp. KGW1]|uniref:sugar transferase n=1 Tax=Halobacillus sp. KGW1 TaxID=1793726 RepID=UPI000780911F|nr:sugar transferase [Halobacillus sp. KGW1]
MYSLFVKRFLDIFISIIIMPFIVISVIVIAPFIFIEDRGPIFFNAERRGIKGKNFRMIKFRSMFVNAPDIRNSDNSTYNSNNDFRVTKTGKILRKTSLDEIPQFINVLKGDMSLIGPRPNMTSKPLNKLSDIEKKRITIRPGITGYNQAYYRNSISQDEKYKNDCYYVDNISFTLDVKIIFNTILSVVKAKNINNPSEKKVTK